MQKVKIAITAREPVLYTEYDPIFEDSPFLIIVDEHDRVQKYAAEIAPAGIEKSRVDWIVARGAKILVTGSIDDESYLKLKRAGVAVKWEAFGDVKSLVERARKYSGYLLEMLENERPVRTRFKRGADDKNLAAMIAASHPEGGPAYIDALEQKAKRRGKKRLLGPMSEDENDNYDSSGDAPSHSGRRG